MSEEKEEKQSQLKHEQQDASKNALKTGAKAAANAYAGPVAGKAVDLASKTKIGNDALNAGGQLLNKSNPVIGKGVTSSNRSLDAESVDPMSSVTPSSNKTSPKGLNSSSDSSSASRKSNFTSSLFNSKGSSKSEDEVGDDVSINGDYSGKIFSFVGKYKSIIISVFGGFLLLIFIAVIVIAIIGSPVAVVSDFFSGIYDSFIGLFDDNKKTAEQDYYNTLKEVQTEINRKYGVCIDVNLITAALTVNTSVDDMLDDNNEIITDFEDNPNYDPDSDNDEAKETEVSYSKMKKQIKLLANMQIMNKKYSLDKNLRAETGYYCSGSSYETLVNSANQSAFNTDFFDWLNGITDLDSSTAEKIADNDKGGFGAFFTKKSNEEKNFAYYLYYPSFSSDGTCTDSYAKDMLPSDKAELSIGDLKTKEDSVFYWNLINSFIPEYYADYLPNTEPAKTEKIKQIADDIYLLYKDIGPSQTCAVSYAGPSSLCPNGITVEGVGTMDLEDYIAGVVSNEAYSSEGIEALKAQAVAARTYALYSTNYCQKAIANSTNAQTFTQNVNDRAREATNATMGEILVDRDGKIFSSQYDSFCYDDVDCPDATYSNGAYTVTYTKVPYGEEHTITLSDSSQFSRITHGQGHAHGMSQLVSYQLAKQGKSYQEILSYFYSDGVEISLVLSPTTTDGGEIIRGSIENYVAIDQFNQIIYDQVSKSGIGTREGVVAAATTLVSGFYSQTGYKLPYELYPSGKYTGYGVDSSWGTNTGRSDYPLNGLDCSGFISWAIHNGGFSYEGLNAAGWGSAGTSRSWSKGTIDSSAQPGDLIYNKPASENGTSGHIRMIIGVTNDGYVVAEASSRKNVVRITNVSFKSTGNYYLVDMSDYYAKATKVTDYPM